MKRPIAISLSPNTQKDDAILALKLLFSPVGWFNFRETEKLEVEFAKYFGKNYKAIAVNSGRSALYLILKTLGLGAGDEVAIQALTCVAVPNSILWLNASPLYIDVDKSLNMDPRDLSEKISEKTKAIIVQHSFGVPAEMAAILKVARRRKILVIEDCALSLGGRYKERKLGTLSQVSFFSFGRDKVISSVFGGMIVTRDRKLFEKLKSSRDNLDYPGPFWVMQQLLHPIIFTLILPVYNIGVGRLTIGKTMLFLLQKLRILSKAVLDKEKLTQKPKIFPAKLPGALSQLALNQLKKLTEFNKHRKKIADYYFQKLKNFGFSLPVKKQGSIWIRFPLIIDVSAKVLKFAKQRGILLGDWYNDIVVPVKDLALVGYVKGSCPDAQKLVGRILNLPTYPTMTLGDSQKVVQLIKDCSKPRKMLGLNSPKARSYST